MGERVVGHCVFPRTQGTAQFLEVGETLYLFADEEKRGRNAMSVQLLHNEESLGARTVVEGQPDFRLSHPQADMAKAEIVNDKPGRPVAPYSAEEQQAGQKGGPGSGAQSDEGGESQNETWNGSFRLTVKLFLEKPQSRTSNRVRANQPAAKLRPPIGAMRAKIFSPLTA